MHVIRLALRVLAEREPGLREDPVLSSHEGAHIHIKILSIYAQFVHELPCDSTGHERHELVVHEDRLWEHGGRRGGRTHVSAEDGTSRLHTRSHTE